MTTRTKELTGWHVLAIFGVAFGIIIAVNIALAVNAIRTFPGLETKNSYVASQHFDADRRAQDALGWDVRTRLDGDQLELAIMKDGTPVQPEFRVAIFGRPTTTQFDQTPDFAFDGTRYVAKVDAGPGNWNLRLELVAEDGTVFRRRIVLIGS